MRTLPIQGADRDAVLATLRASGWFRALQERTDASSPAASGLERLIASADLVGYDAGETIIEEGFPSDSFYLLVGGTVLVRIGREGARAGVGRLQAPSSFGEVGLLLDEPRTATVVAESEVRALRFGARAFHEVFERIPEFGLDTSRYLARRLRDVTSMLPTRGERPGPAPSVVADEAPGPASSPASAEPVASNQPLLPYGEDSFL